MRKMSAGASCAAGCSKSCLWSQAGVIEHLPSTPLETIGLSPRTQKDIRSLSAMVRQPGFNRAPSYPTAEISLESVDIQGLHGHAWIRWMSKLTAPSTTQTSLHRPKQLVYICIRWLFDRTFARFGWIGSVMQFLFHLEWFYDLLLRVCHYNQKQQIIKYWSTVLANELVNRGLLPGSRNLLEVMFQNGKRNESGRLFGAMSTECHTLVLIYPIWRQQIPIARSKRQAPNLCYDWSATGTCLWINCHSYPSVFTVAELDMHMIFVENQRSL